MTEQARQSAAAHAIACAAAMAALSAAIAAAAPLTGCSRERTGQAPPALDGGEPANAAARPPSDTAGQRMAVMELFKACVKDVQAILETDDADAARNLVRGILIDDSWLDRFLDADGEAWKAESMHLEMQQFAAVRVASQPERFARILMDYYHSGRGKGVGTTEGDELQAMALKLVRQGRLFEKLLDDETADEPMIAPCRYSADEPVRDETDPDRMTIVARFLKFRMDRTYEIEFRRLPLDSDRDVMVWLPVAKRQLAE